MKARVFRMSAEMKIEVIKVLKMPSRVKCASENDPRDKVRDLLQEIIIGVTGATEGISVSYFVGDRTTVYRAECPRASLGRLIGAKGRNICAIRTVLAALAACYGIRAVLEIPYYAIQK